MKCFVTGVAGFIGSSLSEQLLQEGHTVIGIDNYTDFYPRTIKEMNIQCLRDYRQFEFIEANLNTCTQLDLLLHDCDWIFHQAAQAGVRKSWGLDFEAYMVNNISATQRLLEASKHASHLKRFIYASSSSVYGNIKHLPVDETAPTNPISPYGVTKLAAEHLCSLYWQAYQVPTLSLRYFTVYGPRQRPDMGLYRFGLALLRNEPISIYGDGSQTRDFTYISDIVAANILAATVPHMEGKVFNIGSGRIVTILEAIKLMEQITGKKAILHYYPLSLGDMHDTFADTSLARNTLGYASNIALTDGLVAEIDFLLKTQV